MPLERIPYYRCQCGRIHFADSADFDAHRLFWTRLETLEFEEVDYDEKTTRPIPG